MTISRSARRSPARSAAAGPSESVVQRTSTALGSEQRTTGLGRQHSGRKAETLEHVRPLEGPVRDDEHDAGVPERGPRGPGARDRRLRVGRDDDDRRAGRSRLLESGGYRRRAPVDDPVVLVAIGRSRGGQPIVRPDVDDLPARGLDLRLQLVGAPIVTLGPSLGACRGEGLDVGGGRRQGVAHARWLTRP